MEDKSKKRKQQFIRRWVRLILAIVSSIILMNKPVYNFPDEKGIVYNRTYVMTPRTFEVHHVALDSGLDKLVGTMSVKGLFYVALAMLIGSIVCTLFYIDHKIRILACTITAFLAGGYYLLMIYYALQLSDNFFMILYPNLYALLPCVVLVTMLTIRNETAHKLAEAKQKADEGL